MLTRTTKDLEKDSATIFDTFVEVMKRRDELRKVAAQLTEMVADELQALVDDEMSDGEDGSAGDEDGAVYGGEEEEEEEEDDSVDW
ncbi:hypothetical protein KIPB_008394, partial [Kipferlia bialata]|eukprot:g8394.t1